MKRFSLHSSFHIAQLRNGGARSANPESIKPHTRGEMDSGFATSSRPGMTANDNE